MPRQVRDAAAKHWVFTLNNPEMSAEQLLASFDNWGLDYAVFQVEQGAEGTRHFQGYLEFTRKIRLSTIKKLQYATRMHLEKRQGTRVQARDYSMKEDSRIDGPFEYGIFAAVAQGKRSDLSLAIDTLHATSSLREVAADHPATFVRYYRGLGQLLNIAPPVRSSPPEVVLLYGPPGCGKTRFVHDEEEPEDLWCSPPGDSMKWFDFYSNQPAALFDDFDGKFSHVTLSTLLRVIDRYAIRVPVKGGYTSWAPQRVYITSNFHPSEWYDWSSRLAQYGALRRRFSRVIYWPFDSSAAAEAECHDLKHDDPLWDQFWERQL